MSRQVHVHPAGPAFGRHLQRRHLDPAAALGASAAVLLAAFAGLCLVVALTADSAPITLVFLVPPALAAAYTGRRAARATGVALLAAGAGIGLPLAVGARLLGGTWASSLHLPLLVALVAAPLLAGLLLLAAALAAPRT